MVEDRTAPDAFRRDLRSHLEVRDPEQATELFLTAFPDIRAAADTGGPGFLLVHDRASSGPVTANRLQLLGSASGVGSIDDGVGVARVLHGRFRLEYGRTAIDTDGPYLRPSARSAFHMEDSALELLEIDRGAFLEAASAHLEGTGLTPRLPTPDTAAPTDRTLTATWHRIAGLAATMLLDGEGPESHLIEAALFDLLITSMLATFPMTVRSGPASSPGLSALAVSRAIPFIEDHLAEPLDTITVARAARVSVRTLQSAFRSELGTGVMAHVRARRLAAAHRDLLRADLDERVTVAEIAHRWGFAHTARFAARHRDAYGESPSQTLRR